MVGSACRSYYAISMTRFQLFLQSGLHGPLMPYIRFEQHVGPYRWDLRGLVYFQTLRRRISIDMAMNMGERTWKSQSLCEEIAESSSLVKSPRD